jgi:hypothetical protein
MFSPAHCEIVIMQQYALWHRLVDDHRASLMDSGDAANRHQPHLPRGRVFT